MILYTSKLQSNKSANESYSLNYKCCIKLMHIAITKHHELWIMNYGL